VSIILITSDQASGNTLKNGGAANRQQDGIFSLYLQFSSDLFIFDAIKINTMILMADRFTLK
jgi:hypothetical protein